MADRKPLEGNGHSSQDQDKDEDPGGGVLIKESTCELKPDETCGCRAPCFSRAVISPCGTLQPLATAKWALILFCIGNMLQQTILNGLYGVTISTLEKRFELRSTESGMIGSLTDLGRATGTVFVIFFAKDLDKPRWIGWGIVMIGAGCLLFVLPHFIAPEYTYVFENIENFCGNVTDPSCTQSPMRNYRYVFIIAALLMGFGCGPLYSCCLTFLDENVAKRNSAFYNSLYMALGGLGPAAGILLGGATLELYTYVLTKPSDITSSDYQWIGAWWIGFMICGVALLINAGPVLLLPKYLPGTEKFRENRNVEAQRSHLQKNKDEVKSGICRALSEVALLLKNKPYVFITLALTMNSALVYGFNTFGAKYLESVFGLTPFHASLIYGIAAIFASFGAQLSAGFIIKKLNLDIQGMLKLSIGIGILSALCSIGFLVHCPEISFAGGTVPYPNSEFSASPFSSCNNNCGCSTDRYQPVCSDGITYFSPCFAGCNEKINDRTYANCSCVLMSNSLHVGGEVSTESCDLKNCILIVPFSFIVFLCFFTSIFTLPAIVQVTLRCVPFSSRDVAIPLQAAVTRIAGVVPGRILVGFVLDFACVAWSTECGEQGACKSYRREEVARYNTFLLIAQTVICAVFFVLVLVTYKPAGEEVNKTEEKSENFENSSSRNGAVDADETNEKLLQNSV